MSANTTPATDAPAPVQTASYVVRVLCYDTQREREVSVRSVSEASARQWAQDSLGEVVRVIPYPDPKTPRKRSHKTSAPSPSAQQARARLAQLRQEIDPHSGSAFFWRGITAADQWRTLAEDKRLMVLMMAALEIDPTEAVQKEWHEFSDPEKKEIRSTIRSLHKDLSQRHQLMRGSD